MKFLQKATLAAAIAAAPFAAQSLEALDDATLAATTGQAGVTIEVNLQAGTGYDDGDNLTSDAAIQVGQIKYTDEGSVLINEIAVGTAAGATIKQDIDVLANGQLQVKVGAVSGLKVEVKDVFLSANGTAATGESLASSIDLNLDLGESTTQIGANSTFSGADAVANDALSGVDGNTLVINSTASVKLNSSSMSALGGKVGLTGITFDDDNDAATIKQKVWATNTNIGTGTAANPQYQGGLNIQLSSIEGDLTIGGIELGGTSIGGITVSDIVMAGVTQKIYGH